MESPSLPPGRMRMAELAKRSGVARETIHFYLREGLLPRPRKGGRTVAYYDEAHLERLRTIRRLREEKYLPLAVIRRLLDSPVAAAPRDIDALAEVLHMGASAVSSIAVSPASAVSQEAWRIAQDLGLLGGARRSGAAGGESEGVGESAGDGEIDATERRVLAVVEDALALGPAARALTLDDLAACAADLTRLVRHEAQIFFDAVLRSGDVGGSITALREGRAAVARFITAYRDRMLRQIVDDLLIALEHGPDIVVKAAAVPLSAAKERELGVLERREGLRRAAACGEDGAAARFVWHLFECGAGAELASVSSDIVASAGEVAAVLVAWAHPGSSDALEHAASAVPGFALGQILAGEAALARALRRRDADTSLLEQAVPALHRLLCAEPLSDPEPAARVLGLFHRGRVEIALPAVLGRKLRGAEALERALDLCNRATELDPAASARLRANAELALGRYAAGVGDAARASAHFNEALAIDPAGPIGDVVRAEQSALAL